MRTITRPSSPLPPVTTAIFPDRSSCTIGAPRRDVPSLSRPTGSSDLPLRMASRWLQQSHERIHSKRSQTSATASDSLAQATEGDYLSGCHVEPRLVGGSIPEI